MQELAFPSSFSIVRSELRIGSRLVAAACNFPGDIAMPLSGPPLDKPVDPCRLLDRGILAGERDPALIWTEGSWSWRDLDSATNRLAHNLLGLGLCSGDRVASLMPNRDVLVALYLACLKAGLVAVPL